MKKYTWTVQITASTTRQIEIETYRPTDQEQIAAEALEKFKTMYNGTYEKLTAHHIELLSINGKDLLQNP